MTKQEWVDAYKNQIVGMAAFGVVGSLEGPIARQTKFITDTLPKIVQMLDDMWEQAGPTCVDDLISAMSYQIGKLSMDNKIKVRDAMRVVFKDLKDVTK